MAPIDNNPRLNIKQAAAHCGVSEKYLYRMRQRFIGPSYTKISRQNIFYYKKDLDAWLDKCRVDTAEAVHTGP